MAVSLPLFINALDYNAETHRRGVSSLLAQQAPGAARGGVLGPPPSITLSNNVVKVGAFNAAVASPKGAYLVAVDSVTDAEGTVGVADATNPRLDRVVLEVLDPDSGSAGTDRRGRLRIIPGTPAALPGLPPLPALAVHLGQVSVPRTGAPTVIVDCPFTAASGAPIPVRSVQERDALLAFDGAQAMRLDIPGRPVDVYTGGTWVAGGSAKQAVPLAYLYSPDPPRADDLVQEAPSVYRAGRRVHLSGVASNTGTVEYAGFVEYALCTLPPGFRPAKVEYFFIETAFTLCRVWVRPDGGVRFMFPSKTGPLTSRLWRFSLSGISFDAA